MRRWTPWMMLVGIAIAGGAHATDLASPAVPPRIPFRLRNNKVILPVTVGASRPLEVILDTGMAFEGLLLYDPSPLDSSALRGAHRARIGGAGSGSPQTALVSDSAAFRVGGVEFTAQRLIALEGDALRGFPSHGVCGYSLFARYVVEIDYARMEVVLHRPGEFRADSTWTAVPLRFKENRIPWVDITAAVRAPDSVSAACYIDLASSEAVEFLTREGMKFSLPDSLEEAHLGRGLSGDIHGSRGRIAWLRLGPARLERVLVAFTPAAVRSKQAGADAVVGNGLLRRFDCVFDYGAGRLYLRSNPHLADPW